MPRWLENRSAVAKLVSMNEKPGWRERYSNMVNRIIREDRVAKTRTKFKAGNRWGWSKPDASVTDNFVGETRPMTEYEKQFRSHDLSFLPSSEPSVRARSIEDLRANQLKKYFEDVPGNIFSFTIDKDIPEGFIDMVYRVRIEEE